MININNYIQEKLVINKDSKIKQKYSCKPRNLDELKLILQERLKEDKNANLNDIDVSNIDSMFALFDHLDPHNIDISEWDVSNVENMSLAFIECEHFDCDLSKWDVSNVTNMLNMFDTCTNFTGNGLEKNPPKWYTK